MVLCKLSFIYSCHHQHQFFLPLFLHKKCLKCLTVKLISPQNKLHQFPSHKSPFARNLDIQHFPILEFFCPRYSILLTSLSLEDTKDGGIYHEDDSRESFDTKTAHPSRETLQEDVLKTHPPKNTHRSVSELFEKGNLRNKTQKIMPQVTRIMRF